MPAVMCEQGVAEVYDAVSAAMFAPSVLNPTIDLLAEFAGGGTALEFAIGTGRVALPLRRPGVSVAGIELPLTSESVRQVAVVKKVTP